MNTCAHPDWLSRRAKCVTARAREQESESVRKREQEPARAKEAEQDRSKRASSKRDSSTRDESNSLPPVPRHKQKIAGPENHMDGPWNAGKEALAVCSNVDLAEYRGLLLKACDTFVMHAMLDFQHQECQG